MSIATKRGDGGQTSLPGGVRVAKNDLRVECYGTVDELISTMGFARSITQDVEIKELAKNIQRELFKVGSAIGTHPESKKAAPDITESMVDVLTSHVHAMEAEPGILNDWSIPGELPDAAAFDVARTVCRRVERTAVELRDRGELSNPHILSYLNRLSDVLWLMGRVLEQRAGADASLRSKDQPAPRWSRAW
jgi:cob(I)alamin adenosyltransferase